MLRPVTLSSVGILFLLANLELVHAQAWIPMAGDATFATSFQFVDAHGHFLEDNSKLPGYRTRANNFIFELGYTISDRAAFNFTVPVVHVKYRGPEEPFNLPDNVLDDGTYHGAVTDLGFQFRYNLVEEPAVITPFFTAGVPSHAYDTLGESAPGRNFQEYRFGSYVGRQLDFLSPRAFVHGYYSYSIVRQDVDIPLNYSSFGLELGYLLRSVSVSFLWRQHWTHGGLSFNELFEAPEDVFFNLDRVVRVSYKHIGAAVSFPVADDVSVFANYVHFINGVDAHYGGGFSLGVSWTFRRREFPIVFSGNAPGNAVATQLNAMHH